MQSENSRPLLLDTIFDVASLTKPVVTATLLLIMQEEGSLKLGDPVQFHLPEFAGRGKKKNHFEAFAETCFWTSYVEKSLRIV